MPEGLTGDLVLAAATTAVAGYLIVARVLSRPAAAAVVLLKVLLPTLYFAAVFDGSQMLRDDATYFAAGHQLVRAGHTPWTLLFEPDGQAILGATAGGRHSAYIWWNVAAQSLFGAHYFAAVFANVLLTFLAGGWVMRIVRRCNVSPQYAAGLVTFFLLHWDLVAWSSRLNLKDPLLLTLTVGQLALFLDLVERVRLRTVVGLAALLFFTFFTRYYAIVFWVAAGGMWLLLQQRNRRLWLLSPFLVLGVVGAAAGMGADLRHVDAGSLFESGARFMLTPRPWEVETRYAFLEIPSALHWFFLLPGAAGAVLLWRKAPAARLVLLHAAAAWAFYALVPMLQGPRHRLQLGLALPWVQFHGLWTLLRAIDPKRTFAGARS